MEDNERKIFIVGDSSSGKTSIIKKFCNKDFPLVSLPTTLEKFVADVEVNGRKFILHIWETICCRHFRVSGVEIRQSIYKDSDLVVIAFDISRRATLENVYKKWSNEVLLFCPKNTPIILVGNKKDKRYEKNALYGEKPVEYKEGMDVAKEINAISYIESSAVTGEGIQEIFVTVGKELKKQDSSCVVM